MRNLINILNEASLTKAQLAKHQGKYLNLLIQLAGTGAALQVSPEHRGKYGDVIQLEPSIVPLLQQAYDTGLKTGDFTSNLPKELLIVNDGEVSKAPWGVLFKGKEFTGLDSTASKSYNAGHLAELFMGISLTTKFANIGEEITAEKVLGLLSSAQTYLKGKNYVVQYVTQVRYPELNSKSDSLTFMAVVPAKSAEAFMEQFAKNNIEPDLRAVLNSAVKYCNESAGVVEATRIVRADKNNNTVDIVSDGSGDAKGTKADLKLSIDGKIVNLISLKTYSTPTIGQISGHEMRSIIEWFQSSFGIDVSRKKYWDDAGFRDARTKEQMFQVIFKLYDNVIYPQVKKMVNDQSPGKEAQIIERLASSANFHARGSKMEDVDVVKLDDRVSTGGYKVLRFSDSLKDAMQDLDLHVKMNAGSKGRTIQILVKPEKDIKHGQVWANMLCQFRSQVMGGYLRNYFEIGDIMVELTELGRGEPVSVKEPVSRGRRSGAAEPIRQRRK